MGDSMLEGTFKKIGEVFGTLRKEIDEAVDGVSTTGDLHIKDGAMLVKQGKFTVMIKDGSVSVDGPLKELRINGKLVRFKVQP